MGKSDEEQGLWALQAIAQVLLGAVAALAVCFIVLFLCAWAISRGWLPQDKTGWYTVLSCILGSLAGGSFAVGRCKGRSLIVGLLTGTVLFLILLTMGLVLYQSAGLEEGGIPLGCGCLCGGALAGLLGARPRKKRRK